MFENARRGRQARNFTTNVSKILDLKSSFEQIFSENWRWVPLLNDVPDRNRNKQDGPVDLWFLRRKFIFSLQCRRILGRRNLVRVRNCFSHHLWFYDSGRLGRVEIVTFTVGARAKEGKGGWGGEKKIRLRTLANGSLDWCGIGK